MAEQSNLQEELEDLISDVDEVPAEEEPQEESEQSDLASELDELRRQVQEYKTDADLARQFRADPMGSMNQLAQQMGLKLVDQSPEVTDRKPVNNTVRDAVEKAFNTPDRQDMKFLAPILQDMLSEALDGVVEPVKQQAAEQQKIARNQVVATVESEMDDRFPEWRNHNNEMKDIAAFIQGALGGGPLSHPKWGNLYSLMYRLVTSDGKATAQAAEQLSRASRNRVAAGSGGRASQDVGRKIREADNRQSKVEMALDAALAEILG